MARNFETSTSTTIANALAGVKEEEKRVLSYAASIGKEFEFLVLQAAMEMEEEPLAELLERLVHHGVLTELKGGDSYAFVREETLAQSYREISSSRLRVIHKRIAEAYEKLYADPPPEVIPDMGRHFYLGRVHEKSLIYNRYAASIAMNAFSPDVAIHYLERAREDLAALPGDHRLEEAEVLKEIGEQYGAMGEDAREDEFYGESLKKLPEEELTMRALLLLSQADAARDMDKLQLTHKYCEEAIRLLEKTGHKKGLAMAHRSLARAAYKESRYELGMKEIEATLGLLDPVKDALEVGRCYIEFGNFLTATSGPADPVKAREYYQRAIQTLEPLHDYQELARAHNNLAIALGPNSPRDALNQLGVARDCAEKAKDKRFLAWILFNSVELHLALGEVMEAAQNNVEARRLLSKLDNPLGLQQVTLNDGILAQHRKAYEESETAYQDALKRAETLGYPQVIVETLVHMAQMHAETGKNDDAVKEIARVKEIGEAKVNPTNLPVYEGLKKQLGI
jgi:tetratricopeptide (TPR) repeat protein